MLILDDRTTRTRLTTRRNFAAAPRSEKNKTKSKTRSAVSASSVAGRIAVQQSNLEKKKSGPRLCVGCGTQVVAGSYSPQGPLFATGEQAVSAANMTKKQAKMARYADLSETTSNFLCDRCKALKSNNIWAAYDAIKDVDPKVFSDQLKHIVRRRKFGMCIVVADATDPEHSAPKALRNTIGSLPAILVLSKCDLLPRMNSRDIKYLSGKVANIIGTRFMQTFAVSAHSGAGIFQLSEYLLNNLFGRDVFCVGTANVGKSTLVQRLASTITPSIYLKGKGRKVHSRKEFSQNLPVTTSHLPGTTLQAVRIPCFASTRHAIWDTPGIISRKAVQYNLFPPHLMEPLARALPIPLVKGLSIRPGQSILIEAAWMDPKKDDEVDEGTDYVEHRDGDAVGGETPQDALPPIGQTCVLGRIDFILDERDQRRGIFVRPFLHPALRMRVVPTRQAPDTATIPKQYVERIQTRLQKSRNGKPVIFSDDVITSRKLAAYTSPKNPEGYLVPTDKETDGDSGMIYMDVCFASLGWISMMRGCPFRLIPRCVEGSVFSKRSTLYPLNLSDEDVEKQLDAWQEDIRHLLSDEAGKRLDTASREGRKKSGSPDRGREKDDDGDFIHADDDEWYF